MDKLLKLALICAVIGLAGLWVLTTLGLSEITAIKDISPDNLDSTVNVCGNITYKFVSNTGHVFMKIYDGSGSINVVIFNTSVNKFDIPDLNQSVCIIGRIDIYKDELEIIPFKIYSLSVQS
jgi:exonuclease VII large subunit